MKEMDGFSLAAWIRRQTPLNGTIIFMLTSVGLRGDAALCREMVIQAYLPKPVKSADLLQALRLVLGAEIGFGGNLPLLTTHALREQRSRLHILLAEDNRVNQMLALHILRKRGHTVDVVENGRQVLAALGGVVSSETFDLILMDMQMPELDGLQATRLIREQETVTGGHLPIIALTANAMTGDR